MRGGQSAGKGAAVPPVVNLMAGQVIVDGGDRAAGEGEQFDVTTLYAAEAPRLWRLFWRRTASSDEASDLVHETFARVLGQGLRSGIANPAGYLTRIAQNLLRDRAKFMRRRSAELHIPTDDAVLAGTDQIRLLEVRDMLDRIEQAMLELPLRDREIFMAHRLEGLTYGEIAERTGCTVKMVEKAIGRAVLELDRALDQR